MQSSQLPLATNEVYTQKKWREIGNMKTLDPENIK
jgi:hypothetical protein